MKSYFKSRIDFTRRQKIRRRVYGLLTLRRKLIFEPTVLLLRRVRFSALVLLQLIWFKRLPRLRRQATRQQSICVQNLRRHFWGCKQIVRV